MFVWFPDGKDLPPFLDRHPTPDSNFDPEQPVDKSWHVDGRQSCLTAAVRNGLFETAVDRLMHYDFYPPAVLVHTSDFIREQRRLQPGDRIAQQIRILPGLLAARVINMVTRVFYEPDRAGFSYVTTEAHFEIGEWTAAIVRKKDASIWLVVQAVSKPGPRVPAIFRPLARLMQKRAHRLGMKSFAAGTLTPAR